MKFNYNIMVIIILFFPVSSGLLLTNSDNKHTEQPASLKMIYSSFLGTSKTDICCDIELDSANNIYISGFTHSSEFPTTIDAYDQSYNGGSDIFVSKISSDGSEIIFSTFLGGSGDDYGSYNVKYTSIALDSENNIYLLGTTSSSDFPTTANAFDQTFNGVEDIVIAKISANGSKLLFSTFLGGKGDELGLKLVLDDANNPIIVGRTISPDFPLVNPYDSIRENYEGFIAKLSTNGSVLLYSSFIGGDLYEDIWALAVDDQNCIYIAGTTGSTNYPIVNAYDSTYAGEQDGFVTKLSANGSEILYSTFLGGSGEENVGEITLDSSNNVYITGWTGSSDFPIVNAYDSTYGGGFGDIFLVKLLSDGSDVEYVTYISGSGDDIGMCVSVDNMENVYFTGTTTSSDFPTVNAYDSTYNGGEQPYASGLEVGDGIIGILSSNGSKLLYSTFLGGSGLDGCYSIVLDSDYNAYLVGLTSSSNFPITFEALDTTFNGDYDAFISKFQITENVSTTTTSYTSSQKTTSASTPIGFDLFTSFMCSVIVGILVMTIRKKKRM
jgi:hypothetical protein